MRSTVRNYYLALKPERTYANVMTTAAGFLFADQWHARWSLLFATIIGTTFVVLSACAANNVTDRTIDARMPRTQKRATVSGEVSAPVLVGITVILGLAGIATLALWANWLVVLLGVIAYIDYVLLYAWTKRTTPWSTLVGTISGAVPLVAGYVAVTDRFNATALALGLIMIFWQMPHFYAISIFRLKDYNAGKLPVWPTRYGVRNTQLWMLAYTVLYLLSVVLFCAVGSTGWVFAVVTVALGLYWLFRGLKGLRSQQAERWARGMFGTSLVVVLVLSLSIATAPLIG